MVLLVCSYNGQEFVRIGYYVNNDYEMEELRENPPTEVDTSKVVRNILSDKPRVTRVPINWDGIAEAGIPAQAMVDDATEQPSNTPITDYAQ